MDFFNALIHNTVFMSAVTGWFAAQVIKTVIYTCITKSFDPERLVGSGGMPSSHSATVCALATAAGMQYGGSSFESYLSGKTIEYMLGNHLPLRRVRILAEHFYRMETKFPIR